MNRGGGGWLWLALIGCGALAALGCIGATVAYLFRGLWKSTVEGGGP